MKRGLFVVIEGLDRAGKSTQVERLATVLDAKAIKFPDRTTAIGTMINNYLAQKSELDDRAIHLLFSANRWEAKQSIVACLESGKSVVCDRYAFSGIAYSYAKGLEYQWCKAPDVGLPEPDVTIFLDLSVEEASRRGGYGEERYESVAMQSKVREVFAKIRQDMPKDKWFVIDAGRSVDEVAADCASVVKSVVDRGPPPVSLGHLFSQ